MCEGQVGGTRSQCPKFKRDSCQLLEKGLALDFEEWVVIGRCQVGNLSPSAIVIEFLGHFFPTLFV